MSRIRSTLDTVTKAVSGTVNADLLAKITRLRPGAAQGKTIEVKVECPDTEAGAVMTMAPPEPPREKEVKKDIEPHKETPKSISSLSTSAGNTTSVVAKQTLQRFQPAAFTTNIDETYNHLAEHVNTYFGSDTQDDKRSRDTASSTSQIQKSSKDHILMAAPVSHRSTPETPPAIDKDGSVPSPSAPAQDEGVSSISISPRKGISHYLSYPRPSVQAFVGNYIAPLVPKFRADSKSGTAEKDKTSGSEVAVSQDAKSAESKEQKEAEEKAQRLLSQREK
ncbi:hypothetical protein M9458_009689, partial [Cirrhinus mrigala]